MTTLTSLLRTPLHIELCQHIHFQALRQATAGIHPTATPPDLPQDRLRSLANEGGMDVYLLSPERVRRVFTNITLIIYRTIADLYCDRLGRNIEMVFRIISRLAESEKWGSINYEAVWAVCLYLNDRARKETEVTVRHEATDWWLLPITPQLSTGEKLGQSHWSFVCVIEPTTPHVLSFRVASSNFGCDALLLVLYDAIVSWRFPAREGAAGLVWSLPNRIILDDRVVVPGFETTVAKLCPTITLQRASLQSLFVTALQGDWLKGMEDDVGDEARLSQLFDNYLSKIHGFGPLRHRRENEKEFSHNVGYGRDPGYQFPALRELLPTHTCVIEQGAIYYDGLHYEHEYLFLFEGAVIGLRQSQVGEACAWVYLDGDILCEAWARELRRSDGNYRPFRFKR